jgi:hypothetical protein
MDRKIGVPGKAYMAVGQVLDLGQVDGQRPARKVREPQPHERQQQPRLILRPCCRVPAHVPCVHL